MPERLLERIIRVSSNVGEMVMDPFAGSGSTLIVAKKLARRFIGFELSKNYARRIEDRLAVVDACEGLAGPVNPQASAPSTRKGKRLVLGKEGGTRTAAAPMRAAREDVERGIMEAFLLVRDGWSVDRVVADPDFNHAYLEKCAILGIAGSDKELNRKLLALRKSTRLKGLPKSKKMALPIPPDEQDRIEFALEIAMQHFKAQGTSFDDVLCDPKLAATFDAQIYSMINKPYHAFALRWLALRLRKRAKDFRGAAAALESCVAMPEERVWPFDPSVLSTATTRPGLYWLSGGNDDKRLYVGRAMNLRARLDCQFVGTSFDFWGMRRGEIRMAFMELNEEKVQLWGQQSSWIGMWRPEGNYEEFGYERAGALP